MLGPRRDDQQDSDDLVRLCCDCRLGVVSVGVASPMTNRRLYPLWLLLLALAYIAVAAINRQYAWAWGREWLAPTMMLGVLTMTLVGCLPRRNTTRGCV